MKTKFLFPIIAFVCLLSACDFSNTNNNKNSGTSSSEQTPLSIWFVDAPKLVCIGNPASPINVQFHSVDNTISKDDFIWTSSNPNIIAVDGPNITAISPGQSTITVSYNEVSKSFTATSCKPIEEVIIPSEIVMDLEDTYDFVPVITPSDAYYTIQYDEDFLDIENNVIIPKKAANPTFISVFGFMRNSSSEWPYAQVSESTRVQIAESLKPHFEFNNQTVTKSINVTTPKNKYDTFNAINYGIHAYDYFGNDITDRITISGDYSLFETGTYNISLSVTTDYGKTSSIPVRFFVVEFEEQRISNINVDNLLDYSFTISTDRQGTSSYFTSVSFVANFSYKNCDALDGTVYASIEVTATPKTGSGTTTISSPLQQMICSKKYYNNRDFTITCPSFYLDDNHNQYFYSSLTYKINVSFIGQAYQHVYY